MIAFYAGVIGEIIQQLAGVKIVFCLSDLGAFYNI
jgi:hypothetical protein